jgi:hypothetical protein
MSEKLDEKAGPDHVELITETYRPSEDTHSGFFFVFCRTAPIILLVIVSFFRNPTVMSFSIIILSSFLDFYITKMHFGLSLVGLKWYLDRSECPTFPYIVFYARPFPFSPTIGISNLFWMVLLAAAVADAVLVLIFIVAGRGRFIAISALMLVLALLNITGFVRCHNLAKASGDRAARSLLLDQNVTFQAAKEANVSDAGSEEEEGVKDKEAAPVGDVPLEVEDAGEVSDGIE